MTKLERNRYHKDDNELRPYKSCALPTNDYEHFNHVSHGRNYIDGTVRCGRPLLENMPETSEYYPAFQRAKALYILTNNVQYLHYAQYLQDCSNTISANV
jgi:hypothetical protein